MIAGSYWIMEWLMTIYFQIKALPSNLIKATIRTFRPNIRGDTICEQVQFAVNTLSWIRTYHQMITQGFCVFVVSVRVFLDGVQKLITKKGESVCVLSLSILIKISNSMFILVKSRRWYDTATAWFLLCKRWNSFFWHATLFCTILIDEGGRWQRLLLSLLLCGKRFEGVKVIISIVKNMWSVRGTDFQFEVIFIQLFAISLFHFLFSVSYVCKENQNNILSFSEIIICNSNNEN